MTPTFS